MMISRRLSLFALALVAACALFLSATLAAQGGSAPPLATQPVSPATVHGLPAVPELKALKYRSIGPAQGGRVTRVSGVPGDPNTYYAATASGGIWKSIDGGLTFKPIFDDQPTSTIGSIAVAPSNPNVVYAGSGEANIRGNVAPGNGIYKSMVAVPLVPKPGSMEPSGRTRTTAKLPSAVWLPTRMRSPCPCRLPCRPRA